MRLLRLLCLLTLCLFFATAAPAHVGLRNRVDDLSARIAAEPRSADLHLIRGEIHRVEGRLASALQDFEDAQRLDPASAEPSLRIGRVLLEEDRPEEARHALDRALILQPGHEEALGIRGRILARLGRNDEAAADFTAAIAGHVGSRIPQPDLYLERATALAATTPPRLAEALAGLDEGIRRLGPAVSVQLAAIDLEGRLGLHDAALARLETMAARADRKDRWLARRAEILKAAGRTTQASAAYEAAPTWPVANSADPGLGLSLTDPAYDDSSLADVLTRGPYLQTGTPTSAVIRWRTDTASDSRVRFGASPGSLTSFVDDANVTTGHIVTISGLSPATRYYYSVGTTAGPVAGGDEQHYFVTAPAAAAPTRVWVLGDSGTANADARAVRDAYTSRTGPNHTDLWLMLGDNAYPDGTDAQYQAAVFDIYPEMLRRSVLWPTFGNHDGVSADSPTQSGPYYNMFTLPSQAEAGGMVSGTEAYYSFDWGNIHFVCLDSFDTNRSPGGAMLTWLQEDLAATDSEWVIAFWHHPPYSKGSHNSDDEPELVQMRANALPILEAAGVDLVLTGHSHSYERSYLLDGHYGVSSTLTPAMILDPGDGRVGGAGAYVKPAPDSHDGAVYVVAGSSGQISGGPLNHPVMFVSLNALGSLVLDVAGPQLNARFLDASGVWRDEFTLYKGNGSACLPGQPPSDQGNVLTVGPGPLQISWTRDASIPFSNLYRGSISAGSPFSYGHQCLVSGTAAQTAQDPAAPPPGAGFYYLLSGSNACGESHLGSSSAGVPHPNLAPCP